MTDRSDLKRRVRERQARTGESYMTALRHVRGQRAGVVPVVELLDISEVGAVLGIKCRTLVLPALAERVDVGAMLRQLHAALLATTRDPASQLMRAVVLYGQRPFASPSGLDEGSQFLRRVRAGIGGFSETGRALSFAVAGRRGVELAMFVLWITPVRYVDAPPSLLISSADVPLQEPGHVLDLLPFGVPMRAP
jgi:hypothetical protein